MPIVAAMVTVDGSGRELWTTAVGPVVASTGAVAAFAFTTVGADNHSAAGNRVHRLGAFERWCTAPW